jgi:hypothetical protein
MHDCGSCDLSGIGDCRGPIDVHHIDKNPINNDVVNRAALCRSHHQLVERGLIDLANPVMPPFVVRGGKRRYLHRYSATSRSEAARLREAKKRKA